MIAGTKEWLVSGRESEEKIEERFTRESDIKDILYWLFGREDALRRKKGRSVLNNVHPQQG